MGGHHERVVLEHLVAATCEEDERVATQHAVRAPGRCDHDVVGLRQPLLPRPDPLGRHHHGLVVELAGRHVLVHLRAHLGVRHEQVVGTAPLPRDDLVVAGRPRREPADVVRGQGQLDHQVVLLVDRLGPHRPGEGERAVVSDDAELGARAGATGRSPAVGRCGIQLATDAATSVLGPHGDLEVGQVLVVLEREAELRDGQDRVALERGEEHRLEVVARGGDLGDEGVERAAYGVGPVVGDRGPFRLEPGRQLRLVVHVDLANLHAPIGTDRHWSAPTNCAMLRT